MYQHLLPFCFAIISNLHNLDTIINPSYTKIQPFLFFREIPKPITWHELIS
uniref:Uncharacterized protein n=1 Tax=Rhizophora mucronata TaxID=61149 RepID=A0A2P2PIJ6_RHIMU